MAIESQNIYKNARKSAGFTQEKASQLLNVSVDSLRDYDELKAKLAEIGFSIVQEVGLVTSVREMDEFYSKQEPALRDFYSRMKAYVPSAFLTAFMAIPFPREAKELLFIVQKPKGEENNG